MHMKGLGKTRNFRNYIFLSLLDISPYTRNQNIVEREKIQ